MNIQLNKHLEKLLGNKICPIHGEKIKFEKEEKNGDITTATLSFCCDEFKDLIEKEKATFEKAALDATKEEVENVLNKAFKKWLK